HEDRAALLHEERPEIADRLGERRVADTAHGRLRDAGHRPRELVPVVGRPVHDRDDLVLRLVGRPRARLRTGLLSRRNGLAECGAHLGRRDLCTRIARRLREARVSDGAEAASAVFVPARARLPPTTIRLRHQATPSMLRIRSTRGSSVASLELASGSPAASEYGREISIEGLAALERLS